MNTHIFMCGCVSECVCACVCVNIKHTKQTKKKSHLKYIYLKKIKKIKSKNTCAKNIKTETLNTRVAL